MESKKYQIIYADPPWQYGSKQPFRSEGIRFHALEKEYKTMGINEIKKLPVIDIAHKDCALFMWATDSHIKEAIELMEAWGFKYVTVAFIWEKVTNKGNLVANLGAWTMKNYELCLFGTRGAMQKHKKIHNVYQKVVSERTKHSRKPQEIRNRIKTIFGDLNCIELFARNKTDGWDVWGNEVESDICLTIEDCL